MKSELKFVMCMITAVTTMSLGAEGRIDHISVRPLASSIIIPQSRVYAFTATAQREIEITEINVQIDILGSTAITTMEIKLKNNTSRRQEAELIIPVPDKAVVKGFAYDGPAGEITANVLERQEAKRIYENLVAKIKDPALVEFIGYNLIRSSVFPLEPAGKQRLRVTYEHLLAVEGNRIDYILPRTESLEYSFPWNITAEIKAKQPISTVYSASHKLDIERHNDKHLTVRIATDAVKEPGQFRLSYLLEQNDITASMFCYPDAGIGGGYFLLLAGLPADKIKDDSPAMKREVTLVIDRSGSMRGEKIQQVKEASLQIIAGLKNGEAFNVAIYSNTVEWFSKKPVIKSMQTEEAARKYIEGITANGGTNIYDALNEALNQEPTKGMLPIILFLTDGVATVGQISEVAIRELAIKSNPHHRRVFTIGVGVDLNAPLLDKIADESKGKSEFILPKEDVEVKVAKVFKRLSGPVLADVELEILDAKGKEAIGRTRDILPSKISDLFEAEQLILLGQYVGEEPMTFKLKGNYLGRSRAFQFTFDFDDASVKNGFVPRLWANRKIAQLIDTVRQMGADGVTSSENPKIKELVDEIVRLSTEFGILTEYTAFLAREGTELSRPGIIREEARRQLSDRAMGIRSGAGAVSQSYNMNKQKEAKALNYSNEYYDENMSRVKTDNIQQINDRAYYQRDSRWIDSRLVQKEREIKPDKVIEFGSQEFFDLAERLAKENRQGSIARRGEIILLVDNEVIMIKMPN